MRPSSNLYHSCCSLGDVAFTAAVHDTALVVVLHARSDGLGVDSPPPQPIQPGQ
jgi:hypothetical protein